MSTLREKPGPRWPLVVACAALLCGIVVYTLTRVWFGHIMFRDQHLGTALEYARGRIDVAHTIIPGFNATNTPTFLELPVWQALLALIFRACGTWFGWANILALLLFSSCLW